MYGQWTKRKKIASNRISINKDLINDRIADLVRIYHTGENIPYAIGGLETLGDIVGVDLLNRYGIKKE
jgi:hypothetical protein